MDPMQLLITCTPNYVLHMPTKAMGKWHFYTMVYNTSILINNILPPVHFRSGLTFSARPRLSFSSAQTASQTSSTAMTGPLPTLQKRTGMITIRLAYGSLKWCSPFTTSTTANARSQRRPITARSSRRSRRHMPTRPVRIFLAGMVYTDNKPLHRCVI